MSIDISATRYRNLDKQFYKQNLYHLSRSVKNTFIQNKYDVDIKWPKKPSLEHKAEWDSINQKLMLMDKHTIFQLRDYKINIPTYEEFSIVAKEDQRCFKAILDANEIKYPNVKYPMPQIPHGYSCDTFCSILGSKRIFEEFNKIKKYSKDKELNIDNMKFVFSDILNDLTTMFFGSESTFTAEKGKTPVNADNILIMPFKFPGIIHVNPSDFRRGITSRYNFYLNEKTKDWLDNQCFRPIATLNCDWISVYTIAEFITTLLNYYEIKTPFMEIYNTLDEWGVITEEILNKINTIRPQHPDVQFCWSSIMTLMKFSYHAIRCDNMLYFSC